jgi:hypothetical protein
MASTGRLALVILVAAAHAPAAGGDPDPLAGDRPGFSDGTATVAPRRVQLEAGLSAANGDADVLSVGEALIRLGLAPRWEIRAGGLGWVSVDGPGGDDSGLADPSLAAKFRVNPLRDDFAVGVLFGSTLAVGDEAVGAEDAQPFAKLLLGGQVSPRLPWTANVGYARASEPAGRFDRFSGSFSLGVGVGERLGTYVEVYGFSEETEGGDVSTYADAGATYLLSEDLQLDLSVGTGLGGNEVDVLFGAGVVKRW